MKTLLLLVSLLFMVISCTQWVETDPVSNNSYSGDDGCISCHTNKTFLQTLAEVQETGGETGGG